ncbi:hypothetical protein EJB05_56615, partial [Eragrostis curvula]
MVVCVLSLQVARTTTKKAPATTVRTAMHVAPPSSQQQQAAESPPATPPQPGFLYTAAPPAVPVPYVWGSWPPTAGYEHGSPPVSAPLCLPPCAWYYPVVADPRGSPTAYPPPFQDPRAAAATAAEPTSPAEEDTDDDPCSLTLAIDVDKTRSAPIAIGSSSAATEPRQLLQGGERDKAATAAEARKRRKELTKLKHMHAGRPGAGEQW